MSNFVQIAQISKTDLNVLQLPVPLLPGDHLLLGLLRRRGRGGHRAGHACVVQKMLLLLPLRRRMLLLGSSSRSLRHFGSLKKKKKERHKCQNYLRRAKEKHKLQYFEGLVNCIKYLFPPEIMWRLLYTHGFHRCNRTAQGGRIYSSQCSSHKRIYVLTIPPRQTKT